MTAKHSPSAGFVQFDTGIKSEVGLRFTMPDERHIVVDAELNGVPAQVVVDSAVGSTVLSPSMAAKLHIKNIEAFTALGITGRANGQLAEGVVIKIGTMLIKTPQTSVFDLSAIDATTGRPVVAVLGYDLFGSVVVDINFYQKTLGFYSPGGWERPPGFSQVSLKPSKQGPREIPISIDGKPYVSAIFDLGSDTALYVSPRYAEEQGLLVNKRTSTSVSAGVEGNQINRVAVLDSVMIGDTVLRNVPVEIPATWNQPSVAFVGLPVLSRFRLVVDFLGETLAIAANPESVMMPFRKDRSGIGAIVSSEGLEIIHVAEDSPASLMGLRSGDVITAINGHKVDAEYLKSRPREGSKPAGTHLDLVLKTGLKVTLVLQDYF